MDSAALHWIAKEYFGIVSFRISTYEVAEMSVVLADLNGSHIQALDDPPSALQFLRLVNISRPVLIKGSTRNRVPLPKASLSLAQVLGFPLLRNGMTIISSNICKIVWYRSQ